MVLPGTGSGIKEKFTVGLNTSQRQDARVFEYGCVHHPLRCYYTSTRDLALEPL